MFKHFNSYKESLLVGIVRILANVLMIGALFLAMYKAAHSFGGGMLTFCVWFFGITIVVWFLAWYLVRQIRLHGSSKYESYIILPHCNEPCLVRWSVIEKKNNFESLNSSSIEHIKKPTTSN